MPDNPRQLYVISRGVNWNRIFFELLSIVTHANPISVGKNEVLTENTKNTRDLLRVLCGQFHPPRPLCETLSGPAADPHALESTGN